jgi:hypothetical protein
MGKGKGGGAGGHLTDTFIGEGGLLGKSSPDNWHTAMTEFRRVRGIWATPPLQMPVADNSNHISRQNRICYIDHPHFARLNINAGDINYSNQDHNTQL